MGTDMQQLVDALGARLGRSVAVDDRRLRLLAHSAHRGEADAARIESLMNRGVSTELADHVVVEGALHATDLFTISARPEIGVAVARYGMPIRHDDTLLGYMWLTANEGPAGRWVANALRDAARQAALILHGEHLRYEISRGRERELVRDLVSTDPVLRAEAAQALIEEDLATTGGVVALVATLDTSSGEPLPEEQRLALQIAVDHIRRRVAPKRVLSLTRPDHALLLTIHPEVSDEDAAGSAEEVAHMLWQRVRTELPAQPSTTCRVGVGRVSHRLTDAAASYLEARQAADVAGKTRSGEAVTTYARLGIYALLAKLSPSELAASMPSSLRDLFQPDTGVPELAETLSVYLDAACDTGHATARLHIHRSTLYNRLRRIEDLTGLSLSRGNDRLTAHLTVKIAQLRILS